MATNSYNLDVVRGNTFSLRLTASDSSNVALNLSGYNVRSYIKANFSDSGYLIAPTVTIISSVSGIVDIAMSAAQTAGLPNGEWPYDLEAFNSGETDVKKLLKGYCLCSPECTF